MRDWLGRIGPAVVLGLMAGCVSAPATAPSSVSDLRGLDRVKTVVVLYAENRSFDHLFGMFPGARGIGDASPAQMTQIDHDGTPLATLPPVYHGGKVDEHLPKSMPNAPFRADRPPVGVTYADKTPNPLHRYYQHIEQINGGKNNKFVALSNTGAWTMAHYDGSGLKMWKWAREFALADHFFQAAFGGSFLNHQWLACACTPVFANAPARFRAQLDVDGRLKRRPSSPASVMTGLVELMDGAVTPDGFAVNDSDPAFQPSKIPTAPQGNAEFADPAKHPLPPQTAKTLGDVLTDRGVTWAWYSEGWNEALQDGRQPHDAPRVVIDPRTLPGSLFFQPTHSPYNYFAAYAPGTGKRGAHLKDGRDFFAAIDAGSLPQVSFFKPVGKRAQHSRYSTIAAGDEHLDTILQKLRASPQWPNMVVIVTYDEFGGYWDHVAPPAGPGWSDRWGPGSRVPAIIVSPFAKKGFIDKTVYDTTSIHKFINRRFGLAPLPGVREKVGDLTNALDLN